MIRTRVLLEYWYCYFGAGAAGSGYFLLRFSLMYRFDGEPLEFSLGHFIHVLGK